MRELRDDELLVSGGSAANLVGLGLASGLLGSYFGAVGMAYAYYNYFKD